METKEIATGRNRTAPLVSYQRSRLPQHVIALAVSLSSFSTGSILGWTAPALPFLEGHNSSLHITKDESSWIGSLVAVGAFFGALPAGMLADAFGRKSVILSLACPLLISWVLLFFAPSVFVLYIARLIAGIGVGGVCTTVPMYISEIAEPSIRGTLCSFFQLMFVCGILYSYLLGAITSYSVLLVLNSVVPLIFLAAFIGAPESPEYLKRCQSTQQPEMKLLHGRNYNAFKELHGLNEDSRNKRKLLSRASVVSMTICIGLMTFQQLSGINIIIFYSVDLFKSAGSTLSPALAAIFVALAQLLATVVSGFLIDKSGRKILLQTSASVMSLCLFVLGWYFRLLEQGKDTSVINFLPLISLMLYIMIFAVGFGPIPWMMPGELLPAEIKGVGTSIVVAFNWFIAFIVTKTYQLLVESMGLALTFWMFGGICVAGFLFSTFVVIETKGKSLSEIQRELSGNKSGLQTNETI